MTITTSLPAIIGAIGLTTAAAAGMAYLLFRHLGSKQLDSKFSERLESYKHAQQQEIEKLRLRINTTFDRTSKLHANEFEALPELWERLNMSFNTFMHFTAPLQDYPDLNRFTEPELEHFLSESKLPDFQKQELRSVEDKTTKYQSMRFWLSLHEARTAFSVFNQYFVAKGLFIQADVKALVVEIRGLMGDGLIEKEHEKLHGEPRQGRFEKTRLFREKAPELRNRIEAAIHARLWDPATSPLSG